MIGGVRRIQVDDADEAWERDIEVDDGELRGVGAVRIDFQGGWNVTVTVMEFVREGPLESELRRRIAAALRSVEGAENIPDHTSASITGRTILRCVDESRISVTSPDI